MSAPAIAGAAIRGYQAEQEAEAALAEEREAERSTAARSTAAGRSEDRSFRDKIVHRAASSMRTSESIGGATKKLKQLKRIGWLIKGVTLGTTSLGDVFISIWVLLFWANMELFIFPLILPWWKQSGWEKAITYALDFILLTIIIVGFGIIYTVVNDPAMACENLGPAVSPLLGVFGKVGGCELAGTVYRWVPQ